LSRAEHVLRIDHARLRDETAALLAQGRAALDDVREQLRLQFPAAPSVASSIQPQVAALSAAQQKAAAAGIAVTASALPSAEVAAGDPAAALAAVSSAWQALVSHAVEAAAADKAEALRWSTRARALEARLRALTTTLDELAAAVHPAPARAMWPVREAFVDAADALADLQRTAPAELQRIVRAAGEAHTTAALCAQAALDDLQHQHQVRQRAVHKSPAMRENNSRRVLAPCSSFWQMLVTTVANAAVYSKENELADTDSALQATLDSLATALATDAAAVEQLGRALATAATAEADPADHRSRHSRHRAHNSKNSDEDLGVPAPLADLGRALYAWLARTAEASRLLHALAKHLQAGDAAASGSLRGWLDQADRLVQQGGALAPAPPGPQDLARLQRRLARLTLPTGSLGRSTLRLADGDVPARTQVTALVALVEHLASRLARAYRLAATANDGAADFSVNTALLTEARAAAAEVRLPRRQDQ